MNHETTTESGRYVWAAILIVLSIVLASVAFISWIIGAGEDNSAVMENGADRIYAKSSYEKKTESEGDKAYRHDNGTAKAFEGAKTEKDDTENKDDGKSEFLKSIEQGLRDTARDMEKKFKDSLDEVPKPE